MSLSKDAKIAFCSLLFNASLVLIKGWLALLSGSVALKADTIHSFTDVISSASIFTGILISQRRTKAFPYGLYKVENLVALIVSLLIFLAGYEIFREVFLRSTPLHREGIPLAILGVGLTFVATYLFSRWELRKGKESNSPSLMADAYHIRTDTLSALAVLVGLLGGVFKTSYLDRIAALVVLAIIGKMGYHILGDAVRVLLDASLDYETMDRIRKVISSHPQVEQIKGLWGRNSGRYRFIEADLTLKVRDFAKAHRLIEGIEREIKEEIPFVDHILIHYEPTPKESITYVVPVEEDQETLSEHFGDAPYFYLLTLRTSDAQVLKERFLKNPYLQEEEGKGIKVSELLLKEGVDKVLSKKPLEGKGPYYVLSNAGVELITTQQERLRDLSFGID